MKLSNDFFIYGKQKLPFPLTDLQQAYWIGEQAGYYLQAPALIRRNYEVEYVNIPKLENALNELIKRHPMLRTEFLSDCFQIVNEVYNPHFHIQYSDLRNNNEQNLDNEQETLSDIGNNPFSCRIERHEKSYFILFTFRLIAFDGKSILQFLNELASLYDGKPLDDNPSTTYQDFVFKLLEERKSIQYTTSMDWWIERVKTISQSPELPIVDVNNLPRCSKFQRKQYRLSPIKILKLRKVARECGVTLSVILCTVYTDILRMWSKNDSFTLNVLYSQRQLGGINFEKVLGNFTSTMLVEIVDQKNSTFKERSQALQRKLYSDMEHSRVSGVEVIRMMNNTTNAIPTMPVVFASLLENGEKANKNITLADLGWQITGGEMSTPQVYLDHQVYIEDENLILNWDIVKDVFLPGVIEEMFQTYLTAIEQLCLENIEVNSLLIPNIPQQYLATRKTANATLKELPQGCLDDFISRIVESLPTNIAIIDGKTQITYKQLWNASTYLAVKLQQEYNVQPDDLVAVIFERGWRQIVALLSVVRAGGAYLPIATDLPDDRKKLLLSQQGIKAVISEHYEIASNISFIDKDIPILSILDEQILNYTLDDTMVLHNEYTPENLAYVIFTSGSTGIPKGVAISHKAIVNTIQDCISRFEITKQDKVIGVSAFNFDLSVFDIFATFSCGATLVLPPASKIPEPEEWIRIVYEHKITIWNSVPALVEMMMEFIDNNNKIFLQSLRLIMMSGDWIPLRLPEQLRVLLPKAKLFSLGGATEASIWSNYYEIKKEQDNWNSIPYGWPLSNQFFHVLDKNLKHSPTWVVGDLYIGGEGLADGYYKNPVLTEVSFIIHPDTGKRLYKTGDLGRYRPNGCLEFLGRNDTQVKLRGFRIELGEIESAMTKCENVHDSIVIVHKMESKELQLFGFYIPKNDNNEEIEDTIREELVNKLPSYMVPRFLIPLERFPITNNGKVDRKQLESLLSNMNVVEGTKKDLAPRDEIEKKLLIIWEKLLQRKVPCITNNFFDLGGSSLLAVRLLTEISSSFSVSLPISSFLSNGTVELQAKLLKDKQKEEEICRKPIVKIREDQNSITIAIHPVGGNILCYRELPNILPHDMGLYCIQSPGDGSFRSIIELATNYSNELGKIISNQSIHLFGWSMGGVIALEMAKLLSSNGCTISSVIMVDSWVSVNSKLNNEELSEELLMRGFISDFSLGKYLPDEWSFSAFKTLNEGVLEALTQLKERKIIPNNFQQKEFIHLYKEYKANYIALLSHNPTLVENIPLHLIRAKIETTKFPGLTPFIPPESFNSKDIIKLTEVVGDHFDVMNNDLLKSILFKKEISSIS